MERARSCTKRAIKRSDMPKQNILIVDDDPQICDLVQGYLKQHGYKIFVAYDGQQMQRQLKKANMDLIILDVMLPGEDGLALCRKLRETSSVSIIMLSAVGDETDRVVGLEMGADDYLAKPFNMRELFARVKALLRRSQGKLAKERETAKLDSLPDIKFLDWSLDRKKRRLIAPDGVAVPLTTGEYELLHAFIEHPGRILTRDQLMDLLHGREASAYDRSIDVQVGRLRKKIEIDPKNPKVIITVRGGGYQFTAQVKTK